MATPAAFPPQPSQYYTPDHALNPKFRNQNPYFNPYDQPMASNFSNIPVETRNPPVGSYVANFVPNMPSFAVGNNPTVTNFAMNYGASVMDQGKEAVQKGISQYVKTSRMKYYFAVNNAYVARKLALVLFPFMHTNWATQFDPSGPVPPGDDINAPDLYIPLMAFVTYVLLSGVSLGIHGRFSPEYLGIQSSQALGWLVVEVLLVLFTLYILNVNSNLSYLDVIAYSGYKLVSMIAILLGFLLLDHAGYYFVLVWVSLALAFFLIRTLKLQVLPHAEAYPAEGNRRRVYLLLVIALVQPFIMWWLTRPVLSLSTPISS